MIFCQDWFFNEVGKLRNYSCLEIGTRRWREDFPTHHKSWFPHAGKYVMTDIMAGKDVDVVADAHELSKHFGKDAFDVIFAASLFEHLLRPWIVAEEILLTLKSGGLFFVQTHQCFPLHSYPYDMWRFTKESLLLLFEKASEKYSDYEFPAEIYSEECGWQGNAYLNVCIAGRK